MSLASAAPSRAVPGARSPVADRSRAGGVRRGVAARDDRGFTLVEVLVAMAILAVGVAALVAAAGASAWRADYLRERELGRWVASNALAEMQALGAWPEIGVTNTEVEMARRRWFLRTRTREVADPDLRRIDIEARTVKGSDDYVYSVTGFVGNPETRQRGASAGLEQLGETGTLQ